MGRICGLGAWCGVEGAEDVGAEVDLGNSCVIHQSKQALTDLKTRVLGFTVQQPINGWLTAAHQISDLCLGKATAPEPMNDVGPHVRRV